MITIITTYAPASGPKEKVQMIAAYSLSCLKGVQVIVLDELGMRKGLCERYGFINLGSLRSGESFGVPTKAFDMGHAFGLVESVAEGDAVMFLNGDNIVVSCCVSELFDKVSAQTDGDFVCLGRRMDIPESEYLPLIEEGSEEECFHRLLPLAAESKRIPYGVDVYVWSKSQFKKLRKLPVLIDGWHYDNWLVNDAYENCPNVFYLSMAFDTLHCYHGDSAYRQRDIARASTEHNRKVIVASYPHLNTSEMKTPSPIPQEWLK